MHMYEKRTGNRECRIEREDPHCERLPTPSELQCQEFQNDDDVSSHDRFLTSDKWTRNCKRILFKTESDSRRIRKNEQIIKAS